MKPYLIRERAPNMNPADKISAHGAEILSWSFGLHTAHYGPDLPARTANAQAYIKRKRPISEKLRRLIREKI